MLSDHEVVRKRRGQVPVNDGSPTNFDLILHLLPSSSGNDSEDEDDADEILRETTLLLLRLFYAQAHSQLESMHQEREILRTAPPPSQPPDDARQQKEKASDSMWRLDTSTNTGESPLLDDSGRVSSGEYIRCLRLIFFKYSSPCGLSPFSHPGP
jgi:immunoglobulin-binding protein 1